MSIVSLKLSSVSPGNPNIKSVVIDISGISFLIYAIRLINVSTSYNLFILFKISLLPDWIGICKCLAITLLFFINSIMPSFISMLDNLILKILGIFTNSFSKVSKLVCLSMPYLPVWIPVKTISL